MKNNKELFNYLIFGVLTTAINIAIYVMMTKLFGFGYQSSTVVAWILAVLFAYYTNKHFVFGAHEEGIGAAFKSFVLFVYYRLLSLIIDFGVMYVFIELWRVDDLLTKIIANVAVVIFNYVTSKLFVFRQADAARHRG